MTLRDDTGGIRTKKDLIIQFKLNNPQTTLKDIAFFIKASHGYARNVWSEYCRARMTTKAEPFPFFVKTFGFWNAGPAWWYRECPVWPSDNRNLQKVYSTPHYSFVIHKPGTVFVYPFTRDWKQRLEKWLSGWMDPDTVALFFDNLIRQPRRHVSFYAPGVPTKFKIRIKGIGTFATDTTPYPKGTMEYEMDPGFERRIHSLERGVDESVRVQRQIVGSMGTFARAMSEHYELIKELQSLVKALKDAVDAIKGGGEKGEDYT